MKTAHITQLNAQLDARRRADAAILAERRRDLADLRNLRQAGQAAVRELERQLADAKAFLVKTDETVLAREWEIEQSQGYTEACTSLLFEALPPEAAAPAPRPVAGNGTHAGASATASPTTAPQGHDIIRS